MYRKLFCLFLLLGFYVSGQSQMRQIYTDSKADNEIVKISFFSPSQGYVAFNDGLGYTIDSGRTFAKKLITISNVDYNNYSVNLTFGFVINGVKAFSQDTLLAYGHYGLVPAILRSVNGGISFKLIFLSQYDPLQLRTGITDMVFPQNGNLGFAVDADRILRTNDRGQTWAIIYISPGSYFNYLEAVDNSNVLALSTQSTSNRSLKTTTGGGSWQTMSLPAGQLLNYAYFISANKGWINTGNSNGTGRTYYTADGGSSWTLKNNVPATLFPVKKMRFINDSTGYALNGLYDLFKTTDSGKIWQKLPRDNNFSYLGYSHNDFQLWSSSQLWAGGGHGFLEISSNGGGTPIPAVYFLIDTTGIFSTGTVNLVNYSKPGYQYQWFVNNTALGSSYNATYTHDIFSLLDSIKLVVSNGSYSDTLVKYQYFYPPVIVSSFTPTTGGTDTVVQIKGQHFTGASSVSFGAVPASFTVLNDTSIRATVGSGASGSVKIITATGMGSLAGFTYIPPPVISSFIPASAKAGTSVIISGQNFNNVTAVSFGGVPAASFTVLSPTSISAVVGVGASGSIAVTAVGGTTNAPGFVIIPDITSFTPDAGTFGTYISISGTGFTGVSAVSIGGIPVSSFTVNSHTSITAIVNNGATGNISLTAPGGNAVLGNFTYYTAPVISSFAPLAAAFGNSITINGNNFSAITTDNIVYFGAVKAIVTTASSTALTVTVPAGASYGPLTVTTHNLTAYSGSSFTPVFANGGAITDMSFVAGLDLSDGSGQNIINPLVGDLDGDGRADIAAISSGSLVSQMGVAVFRNAGNSTALSFASARTYYIPHPGGISIADMDGDGKLDIAVSDDNGYLAYILRNVSTPGAIAFDSSFSFTTGQMKQRMAIADLDGDGKPDLVFSTWWENTLIVHRNISNPGKLAFGPRINIPGSAERNLVLRDLNGDGKPELLDAGRYFVNTSTRGNISFGDPVSYSAYTHSYVAVGDIDGDQKPDIITSDPYGSKAAVYLNTGNASVSLAPPVLLNAVSLPFGIELNDCDGDGKLDIAAPLANFRAGVLKNTSGPGNVSFAPNTGFLPGAYPADIGIISGDLNNDGKPELIVASQVLLNNVQPVPFIASFTPTLAQTGTSVTITGANFTGVTDVSFGGIPASSFTVNSSSSISAIVGSGATGLLTVTNNIGAGSRAGFVFGAPPVIASFSPLAAAPGETVTILGSGFSTVPANNTVFFGSSKTSVLAASASSLTVTVPTGSAFTPISVAVGGLSAYSDKSFLTSFNSEAPGITPYSFADTVRFDDLPANGNFIDVDGDGKLDFLTAGGHGIQIARNTSTTDKFAFDHNYFDLAVNGTVANIGFGDIDGDGKLDIVVTHGAVNYVSVFLNTSSPGILSFTSQADFITGYASSPYGPVVKDLDMDGKPDIVVAGYDPHTVSVFHNISTTGHAIFGLHIDYLVDGYATAVGAQDIDGDKLPDLVVTVNGQNELSVFRNTSVPGTISFALKNDFATGAWPESLDIGDMDNDGKAEVVVANLSENSVSVLHNTSVTGSISFTKTDLPGVLAPWTVWLNDLDGDGKPDLAVQKQSKTDIFSQAQSLYLYKNTSTTGTLSLAPPVNYEVGDYTRISTSCDINGDGKPDIAVFTSLTNYGGGMLILKNKVGLASTVRVCPGTATIIGANISGTAFQWQQNTGTGFVNISNNANVQGTNTDSLHLNNITPLWNAYQYRCIAGTDTSIVFTLLVQPAAIANAGPDTSICAGTAGVVIGSAAIDGNTYTWSPATGLSSASVANPVASPAGSTTYKLTVTNTAGCTASDTILLTVRTIATPIITATGPTGFCTGGTVQLNSSAPAGNQWSVDGVIIPNATAQLFTASATGNYSVKATDISGCSSAISAAVSVTAYPAPSAPVVSLSGSAVFCQGSSVLLQSSDTGTHQWLKDGVLIPGAAGKSYTATQTGNYVARVLRGSCISPASNSVTIIVTNNIATPSISFTGTGNICNGDSIRLLSSSATGNQWYRDTFPIIGAVQPAYLTKQAGNYTVRVNSNGCISNASDPVTVIVNPIPTAPVITNSGAVLSSSSPARNQWYLNGTPIPGASSQTYTATMNGDYSAKRTINNCTSALSNVIPVTVPDGFKVGPNPVIGKLAIWYANNTEPLKVRLLDSNGQPVFSSSTTFTGFYEIDMTNMATGLCIVEIINTITGEKKRTVIIKI